MKEPAGYLSTLFVGIDIAFSIASSFNCISSFEKELKAIDKPILQTVQGLNPEEYTVLNSIPGIGKVYSAGIFAKLGSIKAFQSANALAKYCGIVWNDNDSAILKPEINESESLVTVTCSTTSHKLPQV